MKGKLSLPDEIDLPPADEDADAFTAALLETLNRPVCSECLPFQGLPSPLRAEIEEYRALVRTKDLATMEKRRLAAACPVCGEDGGHPTLSSHWRIHQ